MVQIDLENMTESIKSTEIIHTSLETNTNILKHEYIEERDNEISDGVHFLNNLEKQTINLQTLGNDDQMYSKVNRSNPRITIIDIDSETNECYDNRTAFNKLGKYNATLYDTICFKFIYSLFIDN